MIQRMRSAPFISGPFPQTLKSLVRQKINKYYLCFQRQVGGLNFSPWITLCQSMNLMLSLVQMAAGTPWKVGERVLLALLVVFRVP